MIELGTFRLTYKDRMGPWFPHRVTCKWIEAANQHRVFRVDNTWNLYDSTDSRKYWFHNLMIEYMFKHYSTLNQFPGSEVTTTRLLKELFNKTQYKNFFLNRVINHRNKLPQDVVNANTINTFKNRIDKIHADIMYQTRLFIN